MGVPAGELLGHLRLERLERDLFRGGSRDVGQGSVFGGQVLAQGLLAAAGTVEGRLAHSLHGYFLRPGDPHAPIVYEVDRIRDGRSFTTRRVVAVQHGRPIFNMSISFQAEEEGIEHQAPMPSVPGPEGLVSRLELRRQTAVDAPPELREALTREWPVEIRPVDPLDPLDPEPREPDQRAWARFAGELPDDPALHQAVLAYASDLGLLGTAFLPHGLSFYQRRVRAASLDHAMWFHRRLRADEWLLYAMDSPFAGGGRGLARGSFYARDGALVASVAQEGLVRLRPEGG